MVMRHQFSFAGNLALLLLLFCALVPVSAQEGVADDVTLIGENQALRSLDKSYSAEIITSAGEKVTLEINDAVVETDRILVRFLIWGLSPEWGEKISGDERVYGNYLPVAELGTPSGNWYTPGSGSRFSLIDNGNTLIIAGLLEFLTDEAPEIISFNFNQIPFDFDPLSEGAVIPLEFGEGDSQERIKKSTLSDTKQGVTFLLLNSAQTPDISMIQPAVSLEREDESLLRVGWVSVERPDGKRYALTREAAYGFNIADDNRFVTGYAYTFLPVNSPDPLTVSMDSVYLRRDIAGSFRLSFPEALTPDSGGDLDYAIPLEDFTAHISGYTVYTGSSEGHEFLMLRLLMDADRSLSEINFENNPDISPYACGFIPESDQFACDLYLETSGLTELEFTFNSIEYRIDGNWSFTWTPMSLIVIGEKTAAETIPVSYDFSSLNEIGDPELKKAAEKLVALSAELNRKTGWILQRSEIKLGIPGEVPELIPHMEKDQQLTDVVQEIWDQVAEDGTVINNITLMKNRDGRLISGTWNTPDAQIVLPQALLASREPSGGTIMRYPFFYGGDFLDLLETNAHLDESTGCELDKIEAWCYSFTHTLSANGNGINSPQNKYRFWVDREDGRILQKEVVCQLNGTDAPPETCVLQKNTETAALDQLDPEINVIIQSILY